MQQTARTRIYFLDNLKSAVILMVILHHAAMAYMTVPVPSWGLQDVRTCVFFDWLVAWDDTFVMPLMFFVSGYFALGSAVKYSAAARGRTRKPVSSRAFFMVFTFRL